MEDNIRSMYRYLHFAKLVYLDAALNFMKPSLIVENNSGIECNVA